MMLMISELMEKPLASWRGQERYGNELLDCLTIIFKSGGCTWSKCRMCSYRHERYSGQPVPRNNPRASPCTTLVGNDTSIRLKNTGW